MAIYGLKDKCPVCEAKKDNCDYCGGYGMSTQAIAVHAHVPGFLNDIPPRIIMLGGSVGGAKTTTGIIASSLYWRNPYTIGFVGRDTIKQLSQTLIKPCVKLYKEYDPKSWYDTKNNIYHFSTGAQIIFGYLVNSEEDTGEQSKRDIRSKYRGYQLSSIFFEECGAYPTDEDVKFLAIERLRTDEKSGLTPHVYMTFNHGMIGEHWLIKWSAPWTYENTTVYDTDEEGNTRTIATPYKASKWQIMHADMNSEYTDEYNQRMFTWYTQPQYIEAYVHGHKEKLMTTLPMLYIPSSIDDNKYLNKAYKSQIYQLGQEALARQSGKSLEVSPLKKSKFIYMAPCHYKNIKIGTKFKVRFWDIARSQNSKQADFSAGVLVSAILINGSGIRFVLEDIKRVQMSSDNIIAYIHEVATQDPFNTITALWIDPGAEHEAKTILRLLYKSHIPFWVAKHDRETKSNRIHILEHELNDNKVHIQSHDLVGSVAIEKKWVAQFFKEIEKFSYNSIKSNKKDDQIDALACGIELLLKLLRNKELTMIEGRKFFEKG